MQEVMGFENWSVKQARGLTGYDLFPDDWDAEGLFDGLVVCGFNPAYPEESDLSNGTIDGLISNYNIREFTDTYSDEIESICEEYLDILMEGPVNSLADCRWSCAQAAVHWAAHEVMRYLEQNNPPT